jgi:hypothetical protein
MNIEAMKQALEFVEANTYGGDDTHKLITTLRTAIEQAQKQEPVAWINWSALTGKRRLGWECESELASEPLYTTPPQRQPLTDEEIQALDYSGTRVEFVRAIEAAIWEKQK